MGIEDYWSEILPNSSINDDKKESEIVNDKDKSNNSNSEIKKRAKKLMQQVKEKKEDNEVKREIDRIRPKKYEIAKNHLDKFSRNTQGNKEISKVDTDGGLFNIFDHKVTGEELNVRLNQIQRYLIDFNEMNIEFINEFRQVYVALESLDSEYIYGIMTAVKGAEKASDEANRANKDIKKTVETEQKIIKVLEKHKKELDQLNHLYNIDQIWNDVAELKEYKDDLPGLFLDIDGQIKEINTSLRKILSLYEVLVKTEHINEIDYIWDLADKNKNEIETIFQDIKSLHGDIESLNAKIEKNRDDLNDLNDFKTNLLKQTHLNDIDSIWDKVDAADSGIDYLNKTTIVLKNSISELESQKHIKDIDDIWLRQEDNNAQIQGLNEKRIEYDTKISDVSNAVSKVEAGIDTEISTLNSKLKIAYIISGSSIFLTVITIILNVLGII